LGGAIAQIAAAFMVQNHFHLKIDCVVFGSPGMCVCVCVCLEKWLGGWVSLGEGEGESSEDECATVSSSMYVFFFVWSLFLSYLVASLS
jgi:hypothetical protein